MFVVAQLSAFIPVAIHCSSSALYTNRAHIDQVHDLIRDQCSAILGTPRKQWYCHDGAAPLVTIETDN